MNDRVGYFGLGSNGRLGNQLFQIFSTYGYAQKYGMDCHFNTVSVLKNLPNLVWFPERFEVKNHLLEKINLTYTKFPKKTDVELLGYLQSYKYFENLKHEDFKFVCEDIPKLSFVKETSCFIHVRRGDYVHCCSNLLSKEYYYQAIESMQCDEYVVFSDDISYCKKIFRKYSNIVYFVEENPIKSLYSMSLFKNGIISNSSFSWWGARLNIHPKRIIAPICWFNKDSVDTEDLLYPEWEKI